MKDPVLPTNRFYVKFKDGTERSWSVGKVKPIIHSDEVVELEASGPVAVDVVRELFPHLTPVNRFNAIWFGDLAKTIFGNLGKE